jgi:hypothetical protein
MWISYRRSSKHSPLHQATKNPSPTSSPTSEETTPKLRPRLYESPRAMASYRNPNALAAPALTPTPTAVALEAHAQNPSIDPDDPPSPKMETTAEALTREEVIRRCQRRAAQLASVYCRLYYVAKSRDRGGLRPSVTMRRRMGRNRAMPLGIPEFE